MSEANDGVQLDGDGRERPIFVSQYPQGDARLDALVAAFERGDFRRVYTDGRALLASSPEADIRAATEDLMRRTRPAPLIAGFWGLAVALCLFIAFWAYKS